MRWMLPIAGLLASCQSNPSKHVPESAPGKDSTPIVNGDSNPKGSAGSYGGGGSSGGTDGSAGTSGGDSGPASDLVFAVVGDTRPPNEDDTSHYPTAIISQIWQDVEGESPHPSFAITTGDYMFANPDKTEGAKQLALYMDARSAFSGDMYPAMGNHECTGYTDSNCGSGNADGITKNYTAFIDTMLAPIGETSPYYEEKFSAADGSWTAKFIILAGNAWDSKQESWLKSALTETTTYTFIVRHEDDYATTAPGVTPSADIFTKYPITMLIVGHTHAFHHYASAKEIIVGNGGAPLTSGTNYGYAILSRQPNGNIRVNAYDYKTHASLGDFQVKADGSPG